MANVKRKAIEAKPGLLRVDLYAPGMTALHRVGLAGLWMTLDALERSQVAIPGGSWEKDATTVTLHWTGPPGEFFDRLFAASFHVDGDGRMWFAAHGAPLGHLQDSIVLHNALLGTFLQHNKHRDAAKEARNVVADVDGSEYIQKYRPVTWYAHQRAGSDFSCANDGAAVVPLAGWLLPGGAVRHVGFSADSSLAEPLDRALALLFAPVGGFYFQVRGRGERARPGYALVLPEVVDLAEYAEARADFFGCGVSELTCAGSAEAAWRVVVRFHARKLLARSRVSTCRVISFGVVPWAKQLKTRVELVTVRPDRDADLATFGLCLGAFPTRVVSATDGRSFLDVPSMPALVARNLTAGRPWYAGFAEFVYDKKVRAHVFTYEKGGLHLMVTKGFDDVARRGFVEACHEAWRRRMGQLGERSRRESVAFSALVSREFERQRVAFARAKNAGALRQAVVDLWSRTGPLPQLSEWKGLLPLLSEANWQEARDLALLALASYQPGTKEETEALVAAVADAQSHDEGDVE